MLGLELMSRNLFGIEIRPDYEKESKLGCGPGPVYGLERKPKGFPQVGTFGELIPMRLLVCKELECLC